MSGKKGSAQMKSQNWDTIKVLTTTELSNSQIAGIVGRSASTVGRVRVSDSFEDYLTTQREINKAYKQSISEPDQPVGKLTAIHDQLDTIITILREIYLTANPTAPAPDEPNDQRQVFIATDKLDY